MDLEFPDATRVSVRPETVSSTVDATEVLELGYSYDPVGNLATYSDATGTATFTYDDLDRLVAADYPGASDFAYGYDSVGNVTSITTPAASLTFTYDLADRITSEGPGPSPAAPVYDANGNLTGDGSYGGRSYTYDPLGRLVGVSGAGHAATYELDGAGNRWAQTVDTVTTDFDLDLSVANPTILADGTRVYLPGDPGAGYEQAGSWTSSLTDHLGTGLLTVSQSGSVGSARHMGPYGLARDGTALAVGIGYTAEWGDATGLLNLRARSYDPRLARFVGRDTFGGVASAPQTANRYSYALNNPLRYSDPSGRFIQVAIDHPGELASFAVSLTVVPGLALAAWAAVTGTDPFTGRVLSGDEAAAGLLFAGLGPFGKLLGGAARVAASKIDDVLGIFVRGMKALPGHGLEALRGLRGRGLGLLGDLGAALRARLGVIGRGGAAMDDVARQRSIRLGSLPPNQLGATDAAGNITIQRGLSAATRRETIRHELVHRSLTPRGPFAGMRALLNMNVYASSHLARYAEEAIAEGYATRSLRYGLTFPVASGSYGLSAARIAAEALAYGGSIALVGIFLGNAAAEW